MVFKDEEFVLRSHAGARRLDKSSLGVSLYTKGHKGDSALLNLTTEPSIVQAKTYDTMHQLVLGLIKKTFKDAITSSHPSYIGDQNKREI